MKISSRFALTLLFLCAADRACLAEDPARGRLPDGRAWRLDQQGNQMVDYIAELEMTIEAQNRRIDGLEDELREKNERLQNKPALKEKNLQAVEAAGRGSGREEFRVPESVQPGSAGQAVQKCNCEAAEQAARMQSSTAVAGLRVELEQRNAEAGQLRAKLAAAENECRERESEAQTAVAPVSQPQAARAISATAGGARVRSSSEAMAAVREKVQLDLNHAHSLLVSRDQMYRSFSQQKHGIAFKPGRAASSRDIELKEIPQLMRDAASVHELAAIGRDVSEIEAALQEDIRLMQRVSAR